MDDSAFPSEPESLIKRTPPAAVNPIRIGRRKVRLGFWAALVIGFGSLIALIALSGYEALSRARTISGRISRAYQNNLEVKDDLEQIRSQLQTSAILMRDYLLDRAATPTDGTPERVEALRGQFNDEVLRLESRIPRESLPNLQRMKGEVDLYWTSIRQVFTWSPMEKAEKSAIFIRTRVPRRAAILAIVSQIEALNQDALAKQKQEVAEQQRELPLFVRRSVIVISLLGLGIVFLTLYWINYLERISRTAQRGIEKAGHQLRRLSQQLVHAQEEERKRLSHELHDEVGQLLTALRIELANLDEARKRTDPVWKEQLAGVKGLAEQALRSVRDLAMGLRPAMLDELGLIPALQWQGREHSRRTGIPVSLEVQGEVDSLPEEYRTCVYRVIQETLTNIARHASARQIIIGVEARQGVLSISVKDDGVGFDTRARGRRGLGLLGMTERVKKLGGDLQVVSQPGQGSSILARMPLKKDLHEHEENLRLISG